MYDLISYGHMIADKTRTDAYARALRSVINADSVVLDIGSGTGLFALLACRFGARRVYALETGDAIAVARELAQVNGYGDRISFIQEFSERVTLPEPVDVVVSDLRGVLPLYEESLQSILDARHRHLADNGVLIPGCDFLMAALVDAPDLYEKLVRPWDASIHGVEMTGARRFATNVWHNRRVKPDQVLVAPKCWAELDYATLVSPHVRGEMTWVAERPGTAHGLSAWFETELVPGVRYSGAPDQPELIYGSAFFPLSEPVAISEGDRIDVRLRADLVGGAYTWSWNTHVQAAQPASAIKADFKQSTFLASPMLKMQLDKRAASHRPTLTEDGEIALLTLQRMREQSSLGQIANEICARFPARFPRLSSALSHVGAFSESYSEGDIETANPEARSGTERPKAKVNSSHE